MRVVNGSEKNKAKTWDIPFACASVINASKHNIFRSEVSYGYLTGQTAQHFLTSIHRWKAPYTIISKVAKKFHSSISKIGSKYRKRLFYIFEKDWIWIIIAITFWWLAENQTFSERTPFFCLQIFAVQKPPFFRLQKLSILWNFYGAARFLFYFFTAFSYDILRNLKNYWIFFQNAAKTAW